MFDVSRDITRNLVNMSSKEHSQALADNQKISDQSEDYYNHVTNADL